MQNKEITALETWYLVKKYLNIYHHQAVKENIDVKTIEGYPIDIIEKALKVLEIIKANCSFYTESLFPLGDAYWWHVHLKMQGYIAKDKEMFDLLKEVLK